MRPAEMSGTELTPTSELVCHGGGSRLPQTGWLKEQKGMASRFWGLEVRALGVSYIHLFREPGEHVFRPSPAASGGFLAICGLP